MSKAAQQRSQFIMLFVAFSLGMILSNLLGQRNALAPPQTEQILMTYRGKDKTIDDLNEPFREAYQKLVTESVNRQTNLLERQALQWHIATYASQNSLTLEQAVMALFPVSEPEDDAVAELYNAQAEVLGQPFFEVKDKLRKLIFEQELRRARQAWLDEMALKGDLAILPDH